MPRGQRPVVGSIPALLKRCPLLNVGTFTSGPLSSPVSDAFRLHIAWARLPGLTLLVGLVSAIEVGRALVLACKRS
eukprot:scaffold25137_cov23-Tisochrysis_lutea.AAC.1